ncbi:hypothetical protein MUG94_14575 [Arthrobacter gengyunqii]|uniref:Uncharacterized protein n=1 Tax=Arthrobacter gengyunqii TaxID=2886940 RepID=A0A9X1LZC2_9MICC|nr:hypothetical protein [Arthrobacter gengyunqii]MCC3268341.1 hypothetical protein [Arthrobacter gengyunqii]UOY95740.1 hypothetical protein MUG94_14575 [Arthrobacter gengyunqii]
MSTRAARLVRGWAAAFSATAVAAASHVLAGGVIPNPFIVLFALALSAMVSCALAGRVLSLPRTSAAVLASQGIFHLLFTVGGAGLAVGPSAAALGTAGHAGHTAHADPGAMAAQFADAGALGAAGHSSAAMWFGHLLAAAATVLLIRNGEAALLRILAAMRLSITAILPRILPLPMGPRIPKLSTLLPADPLRNLGVPLLVMRHRGPPAAAVSF